MRKRSLKVSTSGLITAKRAFERTGWTQEYLAREVGLSTRQSIWKFFSGKPVERYLFLEICFRLNLDWEEIADFDSTTPSDSTVNSSVVDEFVTTDKEAIAALIQNRCSFLQFSLDLTQPLLLKDIYTDLKILGSLSSQRWLEVEDLQKGNLNGDHSGVSNLNFTDIDSINKLSKVVIFGKPGSGKTTFLQNLALKCIESQFKPDTIPIFISLRIFVAEAKKNGDYNILNYISYVCQKCNIAHNTVESWAQQGHLLLLLDGLDEVPQQDRDEICNQIQNFAYLYFQNNIFITCRFGACDYHFPAFTYLEIADFEPDQVEIFATKWFKAVSGSKGEKKAQLFLEQLNRKENQAIRNLAVTPILLSLLCSVFEQRSDFPNKKSKIYQAGLEILLVRWDQARGIIRDNTYSQLSLNDKIKLLTQIAYTTFEQGLTFFEKNFLLQIISDYLINFSANSPSPETLWSDSEAILKHIHLQYGLLLEQAKDIYSFSHFTFQEFLAAKKIISNCEAQSLNDSLEKLATLVTSQRWQEIILITLELLPKADLFIIELKKNVDNILISNLKVQKFMQFLEQKVETINFNNYKPAAIRAFYFSLLCDCFVGNIFKGNRDLNLAISIDVNLAGDLSGSLALDLMLARAIAFASILLKKYDLKQFINLALILDFETSSEIELEFKEALTGLKNKLLEFIQDKQKLLPWWNEEGELWIKQLREIVIKYRYDGQDWNFTTEEKDLLQSYGDTNQFLVKCLNSNCQLSQGTKEQLENKLLLFENFNH